MKSLAVVLLALVALCADIAYAQPSADAKARGKFNFYGRGARSAMRGAKESTGSFREYVRSTQPLAPQIVREQPGVREEVVISQQPGVIIASPQIAQAASIDRNLTEAKRNHVALCSCCMEDNVDAKAAMACCQTIDDALGKAISEHDALMKRLGEKTPSEK